MGDLVKWARVFGLAIAYATPCAAEPPAIEVPWAFPDGGSPSGLPPLREGAAVPSIAALTRPAAPLPAPRPMAATWHLRSPAPADLPPEAAALSHEMAESVAGVTMPSHRLAADVAGRAAALLGLAGQPIAAPQLVVVVDRNPAVERLYLMLARPGGPGAWRAIGSVHVSTGQAGRKDYYITPVGVFGHTGAILDFRAQGTFNEHHVRGLGLAGMRVWDFGWQWALKGWHTDGEGGDIRLQMHATDPTLLERRLGRPASEGCVRVSSSMNRFMDRFGVLDADYEAQAVQDVRYRALLAPDRTPTPLAGRFLVVIDSALPVYAPPTAASRPANWPAPPVLTPAAAPGTDVAADAGSK